MEKKRGRPIKAGSKNSRMELRLTDREVEMLEYVMDETGLSKSEVLRMGLRAQYLKEKGVNLRTYNN